MHLAEAEEKVILCRSVASDRSSAFPSNMLHHIVQLKKQWKSSLTEAFLYNSCCERAMRLYFWLATVSVPRWVVFKFLYRISGDNISKVLQYALVNHLLQSMIFYYMTLLNAVLLVDHSILRSVISVKQNVAMNSGPLLGKPF